MASKIETLIRTVRGLTDDARFASLEDPYGLLLFSERKLKAYRENPYLGDLDEPCQLIGVKDNKVVGRRNSFPGRFVADGKVYPNRISGSVFVDPKCRSSMYALRLLQQALKLPGGDVNINCYLSLQNQKFYRLFGSAMFRFRVFEAGGRWSAFYKRGAFSGWRRMAANIINIAVAFGNHVAGRRRWRSIPNWTVEEFDADDNMMLCKCCDLIKSDKHRYRQEITPEWIRWTIRNDFYGEVCHKRIMVVCNGEELIGFALVRYGLATKVNRIYEWQVSSRYEDFEAEFLSLVAKQLYRFGFRVQIPIGEDNVGSVERLNRRFSQSEGNYVVVTIAKGSKFEGFDGINESRNWRVRPGMGDAALW